MISRSLAVIVALLALAYALSGIEAMKGTGRSASILGFELPSLFGLNSTPRQSGIEASAMATLRELARVQDRAREEVLVDRDQDGVGEYAFLGELIDRLPEGDDDGVHTPIEFPDFFRTASPEGILERGGYLFNVYLPAAGLGGYDRGASQADRVPIAVDLAEFTWRAYAWPADTEVTGSRTFYLDQNGVILAQDATPYRGLDRMPEYDSVSRDTAIGESSDGSNSAAASGSAAWAPIRMN